MEKIAIIGMGTGGMAVVAAYAKEVNPSEIQIDCYDTDESFGKGYPYRNDSDLLILNLKTRKISYDYQNNDDLADWIEEKRRPVVDYNSRKTFGEYTSDRLEESIRKTGAKKILEKIVRMDKVGEQWELETQSGTVNRYDRVHLCNGEIPQKEMYQLGNSPNYIHSIYPVKEKLAHIKPTDRVCIIGAGLTAVDVATYLLEENKVEDIVMFSRTNVIPTVRVEPVTLQNTICTMEAIQNILDTNHGRITFEQFDQLFTQELQSHGISYEEFLKKHMGGGIEGLEVNIAQPDDLAKVQALLPMMNVLFNKVWDSMPKSDRITFRKKYHPFMCLNRSPLPLESAQLLIDAKNQHKIQMPKQIDDIRIENGRPMLVQSGKIAEQLGSFDYVINATGLDTSLSKVEEKNELLSQLLDKRYLMVDEYGGLCVVPELMTAISPRYGTLSNLHVHGVLASGVQYRNNSAMIIQRTAHELIKMLYQ